MLHPDDILHLLTAAPLMRTADLPGDAVGLYVLADHEGRRSYVGMTQAADESFRKRIHLRHRTGSETHSHMFSRMYNIGRMWRNRIEQRGDPDGDLAKRLRNAFVAEHCRAACLPLDPAVHDIRAIEAAVLRIAPPDLTAWNGRGGTPIIEPSSLVEATMDALGYGPEQREAVERQARRSVGAPPRRAATAPSPSLTHAVAPLPLGPFRFAALDVETANHDRGSICQIGIAFVRKDGSIATWSTYVDPQVGHWAFTGLHGISARTVAGAPTFAQALPRIETALKGLTVYQHSSFDQCAIRAACARIGRNEPDWTWRDSVAVARRAWPELKGAGGHGLASLKTHLGLRFEHHDAEEDARAAVEVVLHAEAVGSAVVSRLHDGDDIQLIDDEDVLEDVEDTRPIMTMPPSLSIAQGKKTVLGHVTLTQGNIDNHHIYLREVFSALPPSCIGGSNARSLACDSLEIDWGHPERVVTDIDGIKKIFRKRGWVRSFLHQTEARAGDRVRIEFEHPRRMRVSVVAAETPGSR